MSFAKPESALLLMQELAPVSATTGAKNGTAIDTLDYEGVCFILEVGVMTSTGKINMKIQGSIDAAFTTPVDIAGAALVEIADTGGSSIYVINVANATKRYIRAVTTPATAASVFGVTAICYGKRGKRPPTAVAVQTVSVDGI